MHLWRPPRNPVLAPFVNSIEHVEDTPGTAQERMIPGGGISLVVTLRDDGFSYVDGDQVRWVDGACVAGPQQRAQVISTAPQRGMISINFAPGGALPFVPLPLHALADCYPSLQEVWGRPGGVVRERLLAQRPEQMLDLAEEILLEQAAGPLVRDRALDLSIEALDRGASVGAVVERFGTTAKPFIRRFRVATGLTPKTYARLRRLQRLLNSLPSGVPADWTGLAVQQGFFDQSHLVHDFSSITGITPSAYRPRSADAHNHVPV